MSYDPAVPKRLAHIQRWFGAAITQSMGSEIPSAATYITQSTNLTPDERMQLYNQSYWLRLLAALHEEYPFLSRLFGKEAFDDEIGTGYLTAYPPTHWSLNLLGKDLLTYLEKTYLAPDRWLVLKAAEIDWACQHCFFAVSRPEIDLSTYDDKKAEELLDAPLQLQSYVRLVEAPGHFMHYREAFLQQEHEYWLENDFPQLEKDKTYYFILYRNNRLNMQWDSLEPTEYKLLSLIQSGMTIDQALEHVEECEEIALWIQKWLIRQWLCCSMKL